MKITRENNRPSAYFVQLENRQFFVAFEPMHNTINGQPKRKATVLYKNAVGGVLWARSFVVVLNYESEDETAQEIAKRIVAQIEKAEGKNNGKK